MNYKISKIMSKIIFSLMLTFLFVSPSEAIILRYDLHNHPNGNRSLDTLAVDAMDYGLVLGGNTFNFLNVQLAVDSNTGIGNIFGTTEHLQSGDIWSINANLPVIGLLGAWNTNPVPSSTMFDELFAFATPGYANSITYNDTTLSLTPNGAVSPGTGYNLSTSLHGASLASGPGANQNLLITYRYRLTNPAFSGSEWDRLTGSGWWYNDAGTPDTVGDFLFTMTPTSAVPEPASMLLFGSGLVGAAFRKKFLV